MGLLQIVVGGQYGSEAKGHVAGYLARGRTGLAAVRVAGPNAGHTVYNEAGSCYKLQQLPTAAVTNPDATLVIAAGSEIDPVILEREIQITNSADRLRVDTQATILESRHADRETAGKAHGEAGLTKMVGSTGKGVGAARADRIMREARIWGDNMNANSSTSLWLGRWLALGSQDVLIEGTQGYGLGLHAGYYPYCTSSDCRAIDFLGMAGISPWQEGIDEIEIWIVLRTFPIRVAGNSGPMYNEITWAELEQRTLGYVKAAEAERTTVTNKVRRIGEWDRLLAENAVHANGGWGKRNRTVRVQAALMFFDYWYPNLAGKTTAIMSQEEVEQLRQIRDQLGIPVRLLGTGPNSIIDLR
jgi:adenylosuccinate synthase